MLIDCHCHLSFPEFSADLDDTLIKLKNSFYRVIESTVNLENSKRALALFSDCDIINFALGFHPYYAEEFSDELLKEYTKLIDGNKRIVAIGEVGLDIKSKASLDKQKDVLSAFIDLSKQFDLPLVIHNRGFKETPLKLVKEKGLKKVIFHCFSQDKEFLQDLIDNGYFASFAGNITFRNASAIKQAAGCCPESNILSETDSPYLAPQIIRGKRNSPLYVKEVVNEIAKIKNKEAPQIQNSILKNAQYVFRI